MQRTLKEQISRKQWASPKWEESHKCSHSQRNDKWRWNSDGKHKEKVAKLQWKFSDHVWRTRGQYQEFAHRASLCWAIKSFPGQKMDFPIGGIWPFPRKWQPSPVFLPEKSYGQRSLADYSSRGHKELDTTEWLNNRCKAAISHFQKQTWLKYICDPLVSEVPKDWGLSAERNSPMTFLLSQQ